MKTMRAVAGFTLATVAAFAVGGCSHQSPPDAEATRTVLNDMTIDEYLKSHGVTVTPQTAADLKGVQVSVQQPANWFVDSSFQLPNTYAVIANTRAQDTGFVPNATVVVHRLSGDFNPEDAIRRGPVDTTRYPSFKQQSASISDTDGSPTSTVAGTYNDDKGRQLSVSSKTIIYSNATSKLAVRMVVTTTAAQATALNGDVRKLLHGLKISMTAT